MRSIPQLLRHEPRARVFFAAHAQSSFGTGAGYVALLVLAYARFHSAWALTLVLLAEFLPAALLAPLMGALADRWPRKRCLVLADLARAGAFLALPFCTSIEATLALALLAGLGNALFAPAVMAALPSLVSKGRLPAATSLYDALEELGYTLGPALGALAFAVSSSSDGLLLVNGASFAISAVVLLVLRFGERPERDPAAVAPGLLAETRAGMGLFTAPGPLRTLLASSAAFVVCLGMVNVGELLLARSLGASDSQFSLLVAAMAAGIVVGSLLGSRSGSPSTLKRRYLTGLLMCGVALVLSGSVPSVWAAMPAFAVIGVGNGLGLVNQRVLIQTVVADSQLGKAFGMTKSLASWALMAAFLGGGALVAAVGPRWMFVLAGAGALIAWSLASSALRQHWAEDPVAAPVRPAPEAV